MNSVVIYASRYGNTRQVAEAIAAELQSWGAAQVFAIEQASLSLPAGTNLIVVGGPTEVHGMTYPVRDFFAVMAPGAFGTIAAAAFDTRLKAPTWVSGSAAIAIEHRLRRAGAHLLVPSESFFVERAEGSASDEPPHLLAGEMERATRWANTLSTTYAREAGLSPAR
jgi:flavodoxin